MRCPHVHKDAPENVVCEDCKNIMEKAQERIKDKGRVISINWEYQND